MKPAAFWHRYAAWSLDFALLGTLATLFTWSRLLAGWRESVAAATALVADVGQAAADALMAGTPLPRIADDLLQQPQLLAAADALQTGLLHLLLPWLLAYALLAIPWHILGECSRWQGSPGKRALRLRTTGRDGQALRWPQAALRHFAGALSWLTLNLGHALAAVAPQKRALHDYIAGTRVLADDDDASRLPTWARAWLAVQAVAATLLAGWLLLRYIALLQAGIGPL